MVGISHSWYFGLDYSPYYHKLSVNQSSIDESGEEFKNGVRSMENGTKKMNAEEDREVKNV